MHYSFKHSLWKHYLISSILVFLICITAVIASFYIPVQHILKEESMNSCTVISGQMQNAIDSRMKELYSLSVELSLNKKIKEFTYIKQPLTSNSIYTINDITNTLANYKTTNSFISYLAIYFPASSVVITNDGKYDSGYFFEKVSQYGNSKTKTINTLVGSTNFNAYLPLETIHGSSTLNGNYVTYLQSIPVGQKKPLANVIVYIDENTLFSMLGKTSGHTSSDMYILTRDGDPVALNNSKNTIDKNIVKRFSGDKGTLSTNTSKHSKVIYAYTSSNIMNWYYVALFNMNDALTKMNYFRNIAVIIAILSCAMGIGVSVLMTKYNYRPLESFIDYIKTVNNKSIDFNNYENEYKYAMNVISSMMYEHEQIKSKFNKSVNYAKSHVLHSLCDGKHIKTGDLAGNNIVFDYHDFMVIIVKIGNDKTLSLSMPILISKLENSSLSSCVLYALEEEDNKLCIIVNADNISNDLRTEILREASEIISGHSSGSFSIGIGGIYHSTDDIYLSYNEARQSIEYSFLKGSNSIIYFNDIKSFMSELPNLSIDSENRLINAIKAGDFKTCSKLLDDLFGGISAAHSVPIQYTHFLYYNIISTALKVCHDIHIDYAEISGQELKTLFDINNFTDYNQMIFAVGNVYEVICKYIGQNRNYSSTNDSLVQKVMEYVDKNYMDKNLSLLEIADKLGFSSSYLSRLMSEHQGMGFGDYLNKVRLNAAKELLCNGSYHINEITEMTGYSSANSFIRTFKRVEGITPGQYKSMNSPASATKE